MITDEVLQAIHELYEKNQDYPVSGEEDFESRLALVRGSIQKWKNEMNKGTLWRELFTPYTGVTTGSSTGSAPSDWYLPGGSLWIGSLEYKFMRPEKARQTMKLDPSARIYWISGNMPSLTININPSPGAGVSFDLDYYRTPFSPTTGAESTELEMSNPYFTVYDVLTHLYIDDEDTAQADFYLNLANEQMTGMRLSNESTPFYQSNALDSFDEDGFGV